VEVPYPLLSLAFGPGYHYHVLRPLYNYERVDGEGSRTQFIWPLGLYRRRADDRVLYRFLPIFQHSRTESLTSPGHVTHGMVFPVVFWGSVPQEGPYFAVFPLGGVTHRIWGDTFTFVAFPLWSRYRFRQYVRYDVLWPFFSWGGTPDGLRRTVRVWPFYVRHVLDDHGGRTFNHIYLLWPFVRWGSQGWNEGDKRQARRYFSFWPFYMTQSTYEASGELLARQRRYFIFSTTYDRREQKSDSGWDLLFSLFTSRSSEQREDFKIFPFYWRTTYYRRSGRAEGRQWTRYRAPWPLVWVGKLDPPRRVRNIVVVPFYWDFTQRWADELNVDHRKRSITLWPLMTVQHVDQDQNGFWMASHGWSDATEGYKRNYRAFFDLVQVQRMPGDVKETRLLWRLYHQRSTPAGHYISVPGVVSYDGIGDAGAGGARSWSCLLGLLKRSWTEDGRACWRVVYVPLGSTEAAAEAAPQPGRDAVAGGQRRSSE
jgi:hypothetical protein